jgi:AcrR family transcriptional regulator
VRQEIVDAARPLYAAGRRPQVADIARAAGVSRATFYRYFRSRDELESVLQVEPEPGSRERILEAALDLLDRDGLAALSMDEVAERAGVSRASLYRLFPGKPALFTAIVRAYSPFDPVRELLARLRERPPEEVMPELARTVVHVMKGRVGVIRSVLLEVASGNPDTAEAVNLILLNLVGAALGYLLEQMRAGRLRMQHPVLALQSFIGPILFHLLTREVVEQKLGLEMPTEDAAVELARGWLRANRL